MICYVLYMIKTTSYAYILYIYIYIRYICVQTILYTINNMLAISISRGVQFSTIYINVCKYQLIQYCGKAYREGIESYIYILYISCGFHFIWSVSILHSNLFVSKFVENYVSLLENIEKFSYCHSVISCTLVVLYKYIIVLS